MSHFTEGIEKALVNMSATSAQIEALIDEGLAFDDGAGGWILSVAGQKQRALLLAELIPREGVTR